MIQPRDPSDRRTYELAGAPPVAPPLPGEVVVAETADRLLDLLAAEMIVQSKQSVRAFGDWGLALSGGTSPQPLYERLMYDPDCRQIPWVRTHLWMVDERVVPFEDRRSNFGAIRETIVQHSGIPAEQVHPIPAMSPHPDDEYEARLREVLAWRARGDDRLDFVLLGMGDDGHTASLFPFHEVLSERSRMVRCVEAPSVDPPHRVTITYPVINDARFVAVLVTGARKAATLQRVARGDGSAEELPIRGVLPLRGQLKWFIDAAACGQGAA